MTAQEGHPPLSASSPAEHFAQTADAELVSIRPDARLAYYQGSLAQNGGEVSLDSLNRRVGALERGQAGGYDMPLRTGSWQHYVFGRLQGDTVTIGQSPSNIAQVGHAPNGTELERARLGVQGTGYDVYFYRFEADFAQPDPVSGRAPRITDAYAEIRELPFGTLRMGQFRVPLSIERVTSANDLTFIERGLPQAFNPARELGIMAMNSTQSYFFSWYSDVSTQQANAEGEQFGKSGRVDLTERIVLLPWYDEPSEGRYLFQLGAGYLYSNTRNSVVRYGSAPEAVLQYANVVNVIPNFVDTGNIVARNTNTVQAEASTVLGPLSFQAEYYGVFVDPTVNPLGGQDLFFSGWYVFGSYFLTGEHRVYNRTQAIYTSVTPFTNFFRVRGADRGILTGPGAWEAAVRFSQLNLSDRSIQGGRLNDITLGLNWYLTRQMKIMLNYVYVMNDVHNVMTYANIVETRAQVVW
ncbi:MAG: OprO/OprP family phosphate-selective porin [Pirellulales bacterium]